MRVSDFNSDWKFYRYDEPGNVQHVDLPHDAMLHEVRHARIVGGEAGAHFPGGRYVYEKAFVPEKSWKDQSVIIEFEGVYQRAIVYLNGHEVGSRIYGYSNFYVELTKLLIFEKINVLKVEVNNQQTPNARWYTGSGIYRDVNVFIGNKNHILPDGVRIKTLSYDPAIIEVEIHTSMDAECGDFEFEVFDELGNSYSYDRTDFEKDLQKLYQINIKGTKAWSEENPNLYSLEVKLKNKDVVIDTATEKFGIRKLEFDSEKGLRCNDQMLKLRGCCIHHDNGPLGACEYEAAAFRRVNILKKAGYNAIRTGHMPISKSLLRACDTLGMYVMDEFSDVWRATKNTYDYALFFDEEWKKDVESMVIKDYNHPCVVIYSTGNEIYDITRSDGAKTNRQIVEYIRSIDDTRLITNAINVLAAASKPKEKPIKRPDISPFDNVDPNREGKETPLVGSKLMNLVATFLPFMQSRITPKQIENNLKDFIEPLDAIGLNYGNHLTESLHDYNPMRMIVHSETFPRTIGQTWPVTLRNNHIVGDFMWTGWDYLGEVGLGVASYGKEKKKINKPYPCISAGVGSVNLVGHIEAQGHFTSIVFGIRKKPYIGVRPLDKGGLKFWMGQWRGTDVVNSWSWQGYEGKKAEIEVYSNAKYIQLFLNNDLLGTQMVENFVAKFTTIYSPGTLKAVEFDQEMNFVSEIYLSSASSTTILSAEADRESMKADGKDLIYIDVAVTDEVGITKPNDEREVKVSVEGAAKLIAVGSGNPITSERYVGNSFTTYQGRMNAIVRSNGKKGLVRVVITCKDLDTKIIEFSAC